MDNLGKLGRVSFIDTISGVYRARRRNFQGTAARAIGHSPKRHPHSPFARPRLQVHVSHCMLGLVLRWGTDGSLHCSGKYLWRFDCNYFSRAEVGNQLSSARHKRENDKHEQVHR